MKVAAVAGIPLALMEGFYNGGSVTSTSAAYIETVDEALPLKWDNLKYDVLFPLLDHSDCDGEIAWDLLPQLADRLTELLPLLEGDGGGHVGSYREKTQTFIGGLKRAAEKGESVEFK